MRTSRNFIFLNFGFNVLTPFPIGVQSFGLFNPTGLKGAKLVAMNQIGGNQPWIENNLQKG